MSETKFRDYSRLAVEPHANVGNNNRPMCCVVANIAGFFDLRFVLYTPTDVA